MRNKLGFILVIIYLSSFSCDDHIQKELVRNPQACSKLNVYDTLDLNTYYELCVENLNVYLPISIKINDTIADIIVLGTYLFDYYKNDFVKENNSYYKFILKKIINNDYLDVKDSKEFIESCYPVFCINKELWYKLKKLEKKDIIELYLNKCQLNEENIESLNNDIAFIIVRMFHLKIPIGLTGGGNRVVIGLSDFKSKNRINTEHIE